MNWLRKRSIREKLTLIVMATCAAALIMAGSALAVYDRYTFRGELARDLPGRRRVQVDPVRGGRPWVPGRVEHAQVAFLPQDPPRGPVDQGLGHLPAFDRADERRAEAPDGGQLDVDAGGQR